MTGERAPHGPFHSKWPSPAQSVTRPSPGCGEAAGPEALTGQLAVAQPSPGTVPGSGRGRLALTRLTPDPGQQRSKGVWGGALEKRGLCVGTRRPRGEPGCARPGQARVEPKPWEHTPRFPNDDAQNQPGRLQGHRAVARPPQKQASRFRGGHGSLATTSGMQFRATSANR